MGGADVDGWTVPCSESSSSGCLLSECESDACDEQVFIAGLK